MLHVAQSEKLFIVDWDIPAKKRRLFYYYLMKLKKKYGLFGSMSTMSVMVVDNVEVARAVHNLAKKYGESHLYEAKEIGEY